MEINATTSYYRYAGFFHFKDTDSIPVLLEWLRNNSVEFAASLEKMEAENFTDRHVQWCVKMNREWTKSDTMVFDKKGRMGKYLVLDKTPSNGCKHAKRWSKIDCVAKGYDWKSSLYYVGKDVTDLSQIWWEGPCDVNVEDIVKKFHYDTKKPKGSKEKKPTFFDMCCTMYEDAGCPDDEREIVRLLVRNHCFGKWGNSGTTKMIDMARTLLAKYHLESAEAAAMRRYDDLISSGRY